MTPQDPFTRHVDLPHPIAHSPTEHNTRKEVLG